MNRGWHERLCAERDDPPAADLEVVSPAAMARRIPVVFRVGECLQSRRNGRYLLLLEFAGVWSGCWLVDEPRGGFKPGCRIAQFSERALQRSFARLGAPRRLTAPRGASRRPEAPT